MCVTCLAYKSITGAASLCVPVYCMCVCVCAYVVRVEIVSVHLRVYLCVCVRCHTHRCIISHVKMSHRTCIHMQTKEKQHAATATATATHCRTLQLMKYVSVSCNCNCNCNTLQNTAAHEICISQRTRRNNCNCNYNCSTLHHTAAHSSTLQHTAPYMLLECKNKSKEACWRAKEIWHTALKYTPTETHCNCITM